MKPLTAGVFARLADGGFHSGEALARSLEVSRASVWNAVRDLEATGIEVYKVHGRGYRLPYPVTLLDRGVGASVPGESDTHCRAVSAGRHLRHSVEIDRAQAHGKMGTAGGGGEPTRRSRRDRR